MPHEGVDQAPLTDGKKPRPLTRREAERLEVLAAHDRQIAEAGGGRKGLRRKGKGSQES